MPTNAARATPNPEPWASYRLSQWKWRAITIADNPCRALFQELHEVGFDVQVCGATLRKMGWDERDLPPGVQKRHEGIKRTDDGC